MYFEIERMIGCIDYKGQKSVLYVERKQATCTYIAIFISHNSSSTVTHHFLKQRADSKPASHLFLIRLCWPLYSVSFYFLSITSYLTPTYQSEVRDDCLHWFCLSLWMIHGNGKVQTGAVGVQDFPLFFLLSAFFLKSLT